MVQPCRQGIFASDHGCYYTQAPFNFKCRLTGTATSSKLSLFGIRTSFHSLSVEEEEATIVGTAESSVYYDEYRGQCPASKLIDGFGLDGIFSMEQESGCAHTIDDGSIEWFSLELEMPKNVTRVQIANRVDCCLERGQNIRITIGPSSVYDPNEPLCLPEINELVGEPGLQDYVCTGELHEGKFVKISRPGQLNLCEVKVFTHQGKCIDVSENSKFIF